MPTQHPDNLQMFQPTRAPLWLFALVLTVLLLSLGLQQSNASSTLVEPWQPTQSELNTYSLSDFSLGLSAQRDTPTPRSAEQNQSPSQQAAVANGPQTLPVIKHHAVPELNVTVLAVTTHGRSPTVRAPPVL